MNVSIDELSDVIKNELIGYSEELDEKIKSEITVMADEIVKDLKNDAIIPIRSGRYKKSFYAKTVAEGRGYKRIKIANRQYRLTHLLENGHLTRNGITSTTAFPHWVHAQEKAETLPKRLEEIIQNDNK